MKTTDHRRQHRQQFGRVGNRRIGRAHRFGHDEAQVGVALGCQFRGRGRLAHDGQNGALDGAVDAFVGDAAALTQGRGKTLPGDGGLIVQAARNAAQDLRENDAGVAACAHQRAMRRAAGHFADGVRLRRAWISCSAERRVNSMFVPVSPSGTGNTFRALTMSWCESSQSGGR